MEFLSPQTTACVVGSTLEEFSSQNVLDLIIDKVEGSQTVEPCKKEGGYVTAMSPRKDFLFVLTVLLGKSLRL